MSSNKTLLRNSTVKHQNKDTVSINLLNGTDTLVIKKHPDSRVFISTNDSIILGRGTLIQLLYSLVKNGIISEKVLQGIIEEIHTL
jgi:hypothetical protein